MKLDMLSGAKNLMDLKSPPNNRLEKLQGNLIGLYSIRTNDQYRIVFNWVATESGAEQVKIVDYH